MVTLPMILAALIGLLLGIGFGASLRVDTRAEAQVRVGFAFLLMLCISGTLMFCGVSDAITIPLFCVSTVVSVLLQFASDENSIVRLFAETDG